MATRFPLGPAAVILVMDSPRPLYVWGEENGRRVRTEARVTDENGAPLTTVPVVCCTELADPMEATLTGPDALLDKLQAGSWATIHGRLMAEVSTSRDSYDVRSRLEGIERVAPVEKWPFASDFASEVIADAV